ncbi:hypothetical protein OOT55_15020 [Marinimicrobium sp. C6131]|uniref:hypothetical protein n=1 Tax=Marinimicrobium sp. C6131 TaxID=3022676 RepID=UPI00223D76F9|nr:hypothetical protein [Marinimicrobium sp. C6131]UZJ43955.1 hypothetical protein OOT55_15020 [Marinimicrobium sp. C6131]
MPFLTPERKHRLDAALNGLLILCLLAAGAVFLGYSTGYGMLLAPVGWAIALGIFRRWRWAYFASAVWALACYQLAKEGLEFEVLKRVVMIFSIPLVVLSIYLHEVLARR